MDQKNRIRIEEPLSLKIFELSSTSMNGQFLHFQLLIDVLIKIKPNEQDRQDLIKLVKNEYRYNEHEMELVNQFYLNYHHSDAIQWFTRDSFVYRLINKALRVQNVEVLYLFRIVIRDIFKQLLARQCKDNILVFRGQMMSKRELEQLKKFKGNIISMNSFLSTSLTRKVALTFLNCCMQSSTSDESLVPVLFEISADSHVFRNGDSNNRPFGHVADLSNYEAESEVLFMLGSIFRLENIYPDQLSTGKRISVIRMTLCSRQDRNLERLYNCMKQEYDIEETDLLAFANLLRKMGKIDLAEKYYNRLQSELVPSDPIRSTLYHHLGLVEDAKGEYEKSLRWYQKSLKMKIRNSPSDFINISNTYNSIGEIHRKKGNYHQALEFYFKALSLFMQNNNENHPNMATFYNNIGIIHSGQKNYLEALNFYEKSLTIQTKYLPHDHYQLGVLYNNIGIIHRKLAQYDLALKYYARSLEIKMISLPSQHSSIAMTYVNMGLMYEIKGQFEQARNLFKKALTIYESSLAANHSNIIKTKQKLQRVENRLYQ